METCCVLCSLPLDAIERVGLIGNGGLVCRKCYVTDSETARELTGRNPIPDFVFDSNNETVGLITETADAIAS